MIELFLIRHGETEENRLRIFQGQNQGTLSVRGIAENETLAGKLSLLAFDGFYTSPLERASQTAQQICFGHAALTLEEDARLMERNMGVLQGQPIPEGYRYSQPMEGGESLEEMEIRLSAFLQEVLERHPGQRIGVVSHGISIRVMKCVLLHWPLDRIEEIALPGNSSFAAFQGRKLGAFIETTHKYLGLE